MKNVLLKIRYYMICVVMIIAMSAMIIGWYIFPLRFHKRIRTIWGKAQMLLMKKPILDGEFQDDTNIYLLNHRSVLDIMLIEGLNPQDLAWVGKGSLVKMPFFGKIITKGRMISIDRRKKTAMMSLIRQAKEKIKDGRVIAIFPEGTRAKTHKMLDFQLGAEALSNILKLKVQGIVLTNTREVLDLQNSTFSNKPLVKIKILPQIQADKNTDWFETLKKDMQDSLDELAEPNNNR